MSQPARPQGIIVWLPPSIAQRLSEQDLESIWPYLPSLPTHIRLIWIYETKPNNAITYILRLDTSTHPIQLYRLNDSLSLQMMQEYYSYYLDQNPTIAPTWLSRDYHENVQQIW